MKLPVNLPDLKTKFPRKTGSEAAPDSFFVKKKKIMALLLIVAAVGFAGYESYMKYEEHKLGETVSAAMEKRYKDHFIADSVEFSLKDDVFTARLHPEKSESVTINAKLRKDGSALEENYPAVKLADGITGKVREKLPKESFLFIHTDNVLEYTDAGTKDIDTLTVHDYLTEHPDDSFNVSILINRNAKDPFLLRNTIGAMAYTLAVDRGQLNVYELSSDDFEALTEEISRRDSMRADDIKEALEKTGGSTLTLDFSEIYTAPAEKKDAEKNDSKKD